MEETAEKEKKEPPTVEECLARIERDRDSYRLKGERYARFTSHDALVLKGALENPNLMDVVIYAIVKGYSIWSSGQELGLFNSFIARDFGSLTLSEKKCVLRHLHAMDDAGIIEMNEVLKASPGHPITHMDIAWVPGNSAEVAMETYVGVQDEKLAAAQKARDNAIDQVESLLDRLKMNDDVAVTAAKGGHLGQVLDRMLSDSGGAGAETAPASETETGAAREDYGAVDRDTTEPHDAPVPDPGDEAVESPEEDETPDLPGYDELAAADKRGDKRKREYQREAKAAYRDLLASELSPTPAEILAAHEAYEEGMPKQKPEGYKYSPRKPLGRWLSDDGEFGARHGIRQLRASRRPQKSKPLYPEVAPCPRCGQPAHHQQGAIYRCENQGCDQVDPFASTPLPEEIPCPVCGSPSTIATGESGNEFVCMCAECGSQHVDDEKLWSMWLSRQRGQM